MKEFMVLTDYCPVVGTSVKFDLLNSRVSGYLTSGWQMYGPLHVVKVQNTIVLIQAIVR